MPRGEHFKTLKRREPEFDPEYVRDISEAVYKDRLRTTSGKNDVEKMIEKDGDNGEKLRRRAEIYDPIVRSVLRAVKETKQS